MKEYEICEATDNEYDVFLLCLTSESLISYLGNVEKDILLLHPSGHLLIDQLLITGNGQNRYLSCLYHNGKIDMTSFKNVFPNDYYRNLSLNLLQRNIDFLSNSILTDCQKERIKKGIVF